MYEGICCYYIFANGSVISAVSENVKYLTVLGLVIAYVLWIFYVTKLTLNEMSLLVLNVHTRNIGKALVYSINRLDGHEMDIMFLLHSWMNYDPKP